MTTDKMFETQVAESILQLNDTIEVGGVTYEVAPPSVATLILVSEAIARLPQLPTTQDKFVESGIAAAAACKPLAEVAAILILGARQWKEARGKVKCPRRLSLFARRYETALEEQLLELSPEELSSLLGKLLGRMQLASFFGITTFLTEVNLLRPTRKVGTTVKETTVFGQ